VRKFVLDTNIYIAAARDSDFGAALVQFARSCLPQMYLHAVVAQELIAGTIHDRAARQLERGIIGPFEKRGRLIVPTYRSWKRSGEIIAKLIRARKLTVGGVPRSFMNDAVLAASCRETGVTIITLNEGDFRRIASVEGVDFEVPWPLPES
jgi:predicted nucleic acid-binding protein